MPQPEQPAVPESAVSTASSAAPSAQDGTVFQEPPGGAAPSSPSDPASFAVRTDGTVFQNAAEAVQAVAQSMAIPGEHTLAEDTQGRKHAELASKQCRYRVPGYQILRPLGEGTYGEVWHARDSNSGVEVAIKFFSRGASRQWQDLQEEVKQLAMLHGNAGIVSLVDVDAEARPPYFIMAYAEQGCLAKRLRAGPMPVAEAVLILRQIASALTYVHAKGIRHCDLKPGNILLDGLGKPLVADFGQAHLSSDDTPALGTFFFMAPEQAQLAKQIPDARWDVYALGALFHAMVVGEPPRRGKTIDQDIGGTEQLAKRLEVYRLHLLKAPRPTAHRKVAGMTKGLADLIDRCLAIDPQKRPRDAAAVIAELDRLERARRQKPLLAFALLAPVCIMGVLGALGVEQANKQLQATQVHLETQLGQSNLISARLVASKIKDQLEDRIRFVERQVKLDGLPKLIAANDQARLQDLAAKLTSEVKEETNDQDFLDRCTIFNANGDLLATYPNNKRVDGKSNIGVNYAWRDYFHGNGEQPQRQGEHFAPIKEAHVSQPFWSTMKDDGITVGVSAPIRDPENAGQIVGVMLITIKIGRVTSWLKEVKIDHGFAAIVNEHGNVLQHRSIDDVGPDENGVPRAHHSEVYSQARAKKSAYQRYEDPVDHAEYLVGFAPVDHKKIPWAVLVQHEYNMVIKPIEELRLEMLRWGLMMLAVGLGLWLTIGGLAWWWLRREEAIGHA